MTGFWREFCDRGYGGVVDDAFAQQIEAGTAVHLSFDRFEPVDVAFDGPGAMGQAQPGGDRGQVVADPGGEDIQFGLVFGVDALKPGGQVLAKPVTCSARRSNCEQWPRTSASSCYWPRVQVVGPAQQPAGDLADLSVKTGEGRGGCADELRPQVPVQCAQAAAR